jgi:hypothetical protein
MTITSLKFFQRRMAAAIGSEILRTLGSVSWGMS